MLVWLIFCCPSSLSSFYGTLKRLEVARLLGQYSLSLRCIAFVKMSLLGDLFS
jgi:hypothetical protein